MTTQIRGNTQIMPGTIDNAQIAAAAGILTSKLADAANFIMRTGSTAFTADQSHGGFKITNLGDPTTGTDAANKNYVDQLVNGLDWKNNVRVASVVNGALATAFANGQVVDGITLVTGDRILLKAQTAGQENGIYTVNASGAPTRSTDADTSAEVTSGIAVFCSEGATNANTQWCLTTDDPIVLGTTALAFAQVGGATTYTGANGINVAANVISPVYGSSVNTVCQGNDARLSDARTPVGTPLTGGQLYVGNASNQAAAVSLSGDISSVSNTGAVTINPATVIKPASIVTRETPSGAVNGSNAAFTLANTPIVGTESVYLNGLLQDAGAGNDYTISGTTITFVTAPLSGDKIRVSYFK